MYNDEQEKAFIFLILAIVVLAGCRSLSYSIYQYDNGDDYICEGGRRIVDRNGKMGFADEKGNVVISPKFAFVFPFENGIAKATYKGYEISEGEHFRWISPDWFYIDHNGNPPKSNPPI